VRTITRAAINSAIAEKTGIWRDEVETVGRGMFALLVTALGRGENVKLTNFGSLEVRRRAERPGRNPKNGSPHPIIAHRTVQFIPSNHLRQKLTRTKPSGTRDVRR
jgi:integration host factor subunit alpha